MSFPVLDPAGTIGLMERSLMIHAVEFMLIVAIPVYFLLFFFAYRYRAGNTNASYKPDWEHGKLEEFVWWIVPLEIVLVLGALTWGSTHQLDPSRPLALGQSPLVIQVIAFDWKWLFIYPQQNIATVNYMALPVGYPVEFRLTADAPMNSFWIPQLGGQIYAMTGMVTKLNLVASGPGTYQGASANYSGPGFAHMKFTAKAMPQADFDAWVREMKSAQSLLDYATYKGLAKPGVLAVAPHYGSVEPGLFEAVVAQFTDTRSMLHVH